MVKFLDVLEVVDAAITYFVSQLKTAGRISSVEFGCIAFKAGYFIKYWVYVEPTGNGDTVLVHIGRYYIDEAHSPKYCLTDFARHKIETASWLRVRQAIHPVRGPDWFRCGDRAAGGQQ